MFEYTKSPEYSLEAEQPGDVNAVNTLWKEVVCSKSGHDILDSV